MMWSSEWRRKVLDELEEQTDLLFKIFLCVNRPISIGVTWKDEKGEAMALPNLEVGQKVTGTVFEKDANGKDVHVVPSNISVASADSTICTIVSNGDGTVTATAVAAGSTTETISDTQFNLTDSEAATVTMPPPTTIGVTWGTPA